MYKMSPKKVFDVLKQLLTDDIINEWTAKSIAATYAERQIEIKRKSNPKRNPNDVIICNTCGQSVLPF